MDELFKIFGHERQRIADKHFFEGEVYSQFLFREIVIQNIFVIIVYLQSSQIYSASQNRGQEVS